MFSIERSREALRFRGGGRAGGRLRGGAGRSSGAQTRAGRRLAGGLAARIRGATGG